MTAKINLKITQGATFLYALQWESSERVYCEVVEASRSAPLQLAVTGTVPPVNWRVWIQGVQGMRELNREDYYVVTGVSGQTLTFNAVNASAYTQYTSGGILYYNKPVPINNITARMQVRDNAGNLVLTLTTENGGILIDSVASTITLSIPAVTTANLDFKQAVFDLEVVDTTTRVQRLAQGTVRLIPEVTK